MNADREEFQLAARAAGLEIALWNPDGSPNVNFPDDVVSWRWNPRTDDGDAQRLSVALKMTIAHEPSRGGWSVGAVLGGEFKWLAYEPCEKDCRLAIFNAAVKIGESMQKSAPTN